MAQEAAVRREIASDASNYAIDIDDPVCGPAFRHFLLLSRWPSLLAGSVPNLDPPTLFYNSYYWFVKMIRLYTLAHGSDAGLEQQAYQMLETADFDIDWSIIEQIEGRVGREVGEARP